MPQSRRRAKRRQFDAQAFLDSAGAARRVLHFPRNAVIYTQGEPADSVLYIQKGNVKLSVVSRGGKEAIVGMLTVGDFFGQGCLAGQQVRMGTATARSATAVVAVSKRKMLRLLHEQHTMSDLFIAYILARNIRVEEDLVDQLFNSSEKRLARTLLLLSRYGKHDEPLSVLPTVSQETLAEIVGTTRSRVNFFMNKFKRLGLIDYKNGLQVHSSLLSVILHD
jgi:CRP/FNR family transcriptional regulator, cyclic AMP receptor protein